MNWVQKMENCTGIIPYVYCRFIRGRHSSYHKLGKEKGVKNRKRDRLTKIRFKGSNQISWAVRSPLRVKFLSPTYFLKSVKETYDVVFSLKSVKRNPTGKCVQNGACRPVFYD